MQILLIEDDDETAQYVSTGLRKAGHTVELARDGQQGLMLARTQTHDLAIVDRMLPSVDGLTIVKTLRDEGQQLPILFLTTMSGIHDRVDGLEAGGDDYLTKPFALSELLARVNSLSRRTQRAGAQAPTLVRVGDVELDRVTHIVKRGGECVDLQPQEFRLLEFLMRHAGQMVTKTMLLDNVWELHFVPKTNLVETHMSRLRSKLDRKGEHSLILTIRRSGYIFRAD